MRITSLLENTTEHPEMQVEHGLSLHIETEKHRILFDMGQTGMFAENAKILGIDPAEADIAILSHGHYDHGGGLGTFLAINPHAPVYVQRDAFLPHYNGTEKYIGLDPARADSPRIVFTDDEHRIDRRLSLFSCNSRTRRHGTDSAGLTERVGEHFIPDDFRHEQYLLIEENGKRILFSGCSHKGIADIVEWFTPDVLVGGFHVSKMALDSALADLAVKLAAHPTVFYTCHCTGQEQFRFMRQYIPNLHYLSCGQIIKI